MKAAIPIPYIIAILLGILILGIIGYWTYIQSGKAFGTGTKTECYSQQSTYCSFYKNLGFKQEPTGFNWDANCEEPSKSKCMSEILKLDCVCATSCSVDRPMDYGDGGCGFSMRWCCKQ